MICESCGANEASVHMMMIVNGEKTEKNLCAICASSQDSIMGISPFSVQQWMAGILNNGQAQKTLPIQQQKDLVCSNCGMKYNAFKKTGKLGCHQCYKDFSDVLAPLIKHIHGGHMHQGSMPANANSNIQLKRDLMHMKDELVEAIRSENFEQAAHLRDQIRTIENETIKEG